MPHGALNFLEVLTERISHGRAQTRKIAVVAEVQEKFSNAEAVILTEYRGLDVTDMAVLRAAMKQAGGEYKVYKILLYVLQQRN